jgi:hypothetical protein
MTSEQRIRGADLGVDWAVLSTGYAQRSVADLARAELSEAALAQHGATEIVSAVYQAAYALTDREVDA